MTTETKEHKFTFKPTGPKAGIVFCSCGWRTEVKGRSPKKVQAGIAQVEEGHLRGVEDQGLAEKQQAVGAAETYARAASLRGVKEKALGKAQRPKSRTDILFLIELAGTYVEDGAYETAAERLREALAATEEGARRFREAVAQATKGRTVPSAP